VCGLGIRSKIVLVSPHITIILFLLIVDIVLGDTQLFLYINQGIANGILDFICVYLSIISFAIFYFSSIVWINSSHKDERKTVTALTVGGGALSYAAGSLLKIVFRRPRPFETLSARVIGFSHTSSFSFPSTTTMLVFGLSLPIQLKYPKLGFLISALSFLMGFSVIYTGYHFPSDMIAGASLSIAISLCINKLESTIGRIMKS
jgi:undecaprenyl-diphosphatase